MSVPLAAHRAGDVGAPPLVLLHSIATSGAVWHPQVAIWARRHHVIALDLPGHGDSPALPEGADFGDYAGAVAATLDALGIEAAAMVGLSFGSMIAQRFAIDFPERTRAIVLSNGVAFAPQPVSAAWQERIADAERNGMLAQADATLGRWFTPPFAAAAPQTLDWVRGLIAETTLAGYVGAAQAIARLDHRAMLGNIRCPSLVLAGEEDAAAPHVAVRTIADAIPGATFHALPAAHLMNVEVPTDYTETVGAFLATAAPN